MALERVVNRIEFMPKLGFPQRTRSKQRTHFVGFLNNRGWWGMKWFLLVGIMSLSACVGPIETETPILPASETGSAETPAPTETAVVTPESENAGTIHMWVAWAPDKLDVLYDVIDAFQADHPGLEFIVSYVPVEDMIPALEQAQSIGEAPTLILAPSEIGLALDENQALIDLRDLIDSEIRQAIQPLAWTQVETQSSTRGLPIALVGNVLYRNTNLARAPQEQVELFVAAAREIYLENRVGATIDFGFENTAPFLTACGARLFDQSGEFILLQSEAVCWFELLTLFRPVGDSTVNTDHDRELFLEGQSAWMIDTTAVASELAEAIGLENITVDPWPVYAQTGDSLSGYIWSENLYLLAEATFVDREITWSFMRYLVTDQVQDQFGQALGSDFLPVSVAFQASDSFQARLLQALLTGIGRPVRSDFAIYQQPLQDASLDVALRGANPNAAYNVAIDEIQAELSSASGTN
jgi:ABC-type glycerol-3-phosphate transport system substrate-binding protein